MLTAEQLLAELKTTAWAPAIEEAIRQADEEQWVKRLWQRDATLWTGTSEGSWLGWLTAPSRYRANLQEWLALRKQAQQENIDTVLLAGMGGSSLCPLFWQQLFSAPSPPRLRVIDSTVPDQIRRTIADVNWERTWVFVSSKSGTTAETAALAAFFRAKLDEVLGARAPARMWAITDPNSPLAETATQEGYGGLFLGDPTIGGRFSAFSPFGLVPAAVHGAPVKELADAAAEAEQEAQAEAVRNPGVLLGILLGIAAQQGADKLTIVTSPTIAGFGLWIEQLVAESTGKNGKGIVPVVEEPLGPPDVYGRDRLFVYCRLASAPDPQQDAALAHLKAAGYPTVTVTITDAIDVARWMYRWEIAISVASILLKVNPFDQPNVEQTKRKTRELLSEYEGSGVLPRPQWLRQGEDLRCFVPDHNSPLGRAFREANVSAALETLFQHVRDSSAYVSINAYLSEDPRLLPDIQWVRRIIRDATRCAVPFGYGPRYLHSTGQLHKGGPPNAVFLFISAEDREDLPVPGTGYSFGVLKEAQAYGDVLALHEVGRQVLWVGLGPDPLAGLARLRIALEEAAGARR